MFCGKCGNQLADGAAFCPVCGQPTANAVQPVQQQYQRPVFNNPDGYQMPRQQAAVQSGSNKNLIIGIIVAVAVIAAIVVSIFVLGGKKSSGKDDDDDIPAYETPLQDFCDGLMEADGKKLLGTEMPSSVLKVWEKEGYIDWDDVDEELEDALEEFKDEFGSNFKMTYKATHKNKLSKEELEDYSSTYSAWANMTDKDEDDFVPTQGYKLKVTFSARGKDDSDTDEATVVVAEVDGNWVFLDMGSLGSLI